MTLLVLAGALVLEIRALRQGKQNAKGLSWLSSVGVMLGAWWLIAWVMAYYEGWMVGIKTFLASLVLIGMYGFLSLLLLHHLANRIKPKD